MTLDLDGLLAEPLPATLKGLSPRAVGQPLAALGSLGLSVLSGDLPLPVAVLKESALAHNSDWMRGFTQRAGVSLCPHGKTTMAPQLFQRQLDAGSWGITAATASHVRTYRRFGVQRVLMANQLVGRGNIEIVLDELAADPGFDFYCLVDSMEGLAQLRDVLARRPPQAPLQVLLEMGLTGGRTGVRGLDDAVALGRALRDAAPVVALRGIEGYEGVAGGDEPARVELAVHGLLDTLAEVARLGQAEDWFAPGELILTAGGSAFFDIAATVLAAVPAHRPTRVVMRSGCYLSHDSLHYERMQARMRQRAGAVWGSGPGLRNALEVWAFVQSVPEPHRAICNLGRRDVSYDVCLPQPLWWYRPGLHHQPQPVPGHLRVPALFDQHAYVDADPGPIPWRVGDMVGFGIGHPCTTFDKWPLLHTVDDRYAVTGGIRTFF
jgi:D-serine dehydratase